jgi:predicted PurR-regulated permease PerM
VKAFGVMGLFIGPVVLSVTLVLLQMLQESNLDYPMTDGASPGPSVRG